MQAPPEEFVNEDRELEFQRDIMKKRGENVCPYGEEPAKQAETKSSTDTE